jgi:hypothetical protein
MSCHRAQIERVAHKEEVTSKRVAFHLSHLPVKGRGKVREPY